MAWNSAAGGGGGGNWNDGGSKAKNDSPAATNIWNGGAGKPSALDDGQAGGGFDDSKGSSDVLSSGRNDGNCFNCGQPGHMKGDCPEPPKNFGECYNCGQTGHNKAECSNERVAREFTGECRSCGEQGHRAADCPQAGPKICKNCQEAGHNINDCKNPRKIDRSHVPDMLPEMAWKKLEEASNERDLDDMKAAIDKYVKGNPMITYVELEKACRDQGLNCYLVATERELSATYTNMDLQGNLDKKYTVSYRLSATPKRPKEAEGWPSTPEENFERLKDAGEPVDRGVPKCSNCDQLGHIFKSCTEEKQENADRVVIKCYNCDEIGHRVRDCPTPREDKFACRNCKKPGHGAKECPEPRSAENVECRKCGETGHFSRDCPTAPSDSSGCRNCGQEGHMAKECTEPKDMSKVQCRNCDEMGHNSRDCPKPRDYSRVQCQNCKKLGHTKVRCKEQLVEDDNEAGGNNAEDNCAPEESATVNGDSAWASSSAPPTGGDSWTSAPTSAPSGW